MSDVTRSYWLQGGKKRGREIRKDTLVLSWREKNELGKWNLGGREGMG